MTEHDPPQEPRRIVLEALVGHFSGGLPIEALPPDVVRRLGEELAASRLVREELTAFWNLLDAALAAAGWRPPPPGRALELLNLACGPCVEAAVLSAWFGQTGLPAGTRRPVRFFGMDLRGEQIDKAERRYEATEALFRKAGVPRLAERPGGEGAAGSVEFFADDATRLVGYRQIPAAFDIIFIRHQNVWHDRVVWRRIFTFALDRLRPPDGRLVITSYFDREHLIALDLLRKLGGRVETTRRNPDSRPLDFPGKSADRHIAVVAQGGKGAGEKP